MREKFANGFKSDVFRANSLDSLRFSSADLVKEDIDQDRQWFGRLFYRHKIAHTLFPSNFINVVAATVSPYEVDLYNEYQMGDGTINQQPIERTHRLYSVLADIPSEHSTFASHMEYVKNHDKRVIEKGSICTCSSCISHREFHLQNNIEDAAKNFSKRANVFGIGLDTHDHSDHCISSDGDIIFFEIDNFNPKLLRSHLESIINPTLAEKGALIMLGRYDELFLISRQDMFSRRSGSLRLN